MVIVSWKVECDDLFYALQNVEESITGFFVQISDDGVATYAIFSCFVCSCLFIESYQDINHRVIIFRSRFVLSHSWEQPIGELTMSENIDFSRFRERDDAHNFEFYRSRSATMPL